MHIILLSRVTVSVVTVFVVVVPRVHTRTYDFVIYTTFDDMRTRSIRFSKRLLVPTTVDMRAFQVHFRFYYILSESFVRVPLCPYNRYTRKQSDEIAEIVYTWTIFILFDS